MLAVDKNIWKFLPSFYPVFPGSTCVVCGLALRIIAYSHLLEYLSMHLLEMEPLLYPAGRYFLFSQSFSSAATLLSIRSQLTAKRRREECVKGRSDPARVSWEMRCIHCLDDEA